MQGVCATNNQFPDVFERSLLNFDRTGGQFGKNVGWGAAGRTLIPCRDTLDETKAYDTHAPLKVLSPRGDDWWKFYSRHAQESLGLEVTEEGEGVGSDMGGCVGMTQSGGDGRDDQSNTTDDGNDPTNCRNVDGLSICQFGLEACDGLASGCAVDVDLHARIKVRNSIGDT